MRECRRARSSPHEVEGDRELSSAGMRTRGRMRTRGFLPCEITLSRDHLRLSAANFTRVRMTASASRCCTILHDEDMEIGGLSDYNYCRHAGGGRGGGGSTGAGTRGGPGRSPSRVQGRSPDGGAGGGGGRLSRNELKMFHEQILSRNEACFVKIRKQMTTEKKITTSH